jgi:hypothetical protein
MGQSKTAPRGPTLCKGQRFAPPLSLEHTPGKIGIVATFRWNGYPAGVHFWPNRDVSIFDNAAIEACRNTLSRAPQRAAGIIIGPVLPSSKTVRGLRGELRSQMGIIGFGLHVWPPRIGLYMSVPNGTQYFFAPRYIFFTVDGNQGNRIIDLCE